MHTTPAYSVRLLVKLYHQPGVLGRFATALGAAGGNITKLRSFEVVGESVTREFVVDARDEEHVAFLMETLGDLDGVEILEAADMTFHIHRGGKLDVVGRFPLEDNDTLSMAYTPGVARVSSAIADDPAKAWRYTGRGNLVAVISDGTAVLGLGDIGPLGAMPVMEGKAMLFKEFANINAMPIVLDTTDTEEIIKTVANLAPTFGGINLEDISAPRCFEIEERLKAMLDIPVFHDDQHGTAIVCLAALQNACKLTGRTLADLKVVMVGAGAAGVAIAKILRGAGASDIISVDRHGAIFEGRGDLTGGKIWLAEKTNPRRISGDLSEAIVGADVFIGVSGPGILSREQVVSMAPDPIIFALANPTPEIMPELIQDVAGIIATGRSDYPNQINNVLAFPGVFRGALDAGATSVTENMKLAAAQAIAEAVGDELAADHIVPAALDRSVSVAVAVAVATQARIDGVCRD